MNFIIVLNIICLILWEQFVVHCIRYILFLLIKWYLLVRIRLNTLSFLPIVGSITNDLDNPSTFFVQVFRFGLALSLAIAVLALYNRFVSVSTHVHVLYEPDHTLTPLCCSVEVLGRTIFSTASCSVHWVLFMLAFAIRLARKKKSLLCYPVISPALFLSPLLGICTKLDGSYKNNPIHSTQIFLVWPGSECGQDICKGVVKLLQ